MSRFSTKASSHSESKKATRKRNTMKNTGYSVAARASRLAGSGCTTSMFCTTFPANTERGRRREGSLTVRGAHSQHSLNARISHCSNLAKRRRLATHLSAMSRNHAGQQSRRTRCKRVSWTGTSPALPAASISCTTSITKLTKRSTTGRVATGALAFSRSFARSPASGSGSKTSARALKTRLSSRSGITRGTLWIKARSNATSHACSSSDRLVSCATIWLRREEPSEVSNKEATKFL
mmetsp:Transcript_112908/g.224736  ORF Transcript_112908/g.224736 Transcript_112908/m.224736 type:complete len:237 (-) Transcript_112908:2845-3555(-)